MNGKGSEDQDFFFFNSVFHLSSSPSEQKTFFQSNTNSEDAKTLKSEGFNDISNIIRSISTLCADVVINGDKDLRVVEYADIVVM